MPDTVAVLILNSPFGRVEAHWGPNGIRRLDLNAEGTDQGDPALVAQVLAALKGGPLPPLDPAGTAFQQEVWRVLRELPPGERVTYTQLAERAGRPKAVRAVASACAANPIAVLTPCHRVVPTSGGTGRYRWGDGTKQAVLAQEIALRAPDLVLA